MMRKGALVPEASLDSRALETAGGRWTGKQTIEHRSGGGYGGL